MGPDQNQINTGLRQGIEATTCTPEEIIMVVLDTSESMSFPYLDKKSKYQSLLEAFETFCFWTTDYDLKHFIGLIIFANQSILQYPISENFRAFNSKFTFFPPENVTTVYNAISYAIQTINQFTVKYLDYFDIPKRILCLTDGYDNNSTVTAEEATQELIDSEITMDCVLLCEEMVYTHAIAKATGGYSFKPSSTQELINIFQEEPMLAMKSRPKIIPAYKKEEEVDLKIQAAVPVDTKLYYILPDKLNLPVQTAHNCLARIIYNTCSPTTSTEKMKRILQELLYYQSHPHPDFEIFPCQNNLDFWRIIMTGPEGTPYSKATFELFIEFKDDYPAKPPNIRFITPIYHCNLKSGARIYHAILGRFYSPDVRIRQILDYVYGLLIDPETNDALDSVKATELRNDTPLYLQKAWDHAEIHARVKTKHEVRIELLGCDQDVQVSYAKHLVCPLTLALFVDPVITPEGETYEKDAILEHLRSGMNYDPFSYKELKEEELRANRAILSIVKNYQNEIENGGKL